MSWSGGHVVHEPPAWRWSGSGLRPWPLRLGFSVGGARRRVMRRDPAGARGSGDRVVLGEDVGSEQQELVGVDGLAGAAEPLAEQPVELVLHMADEESGPGGASRAALG